MRRVISVMVVVGLLVVGAGVWAGQLWQRMPLMSGFGRECQVDAVEAGADGEVRLDREQLANAATITAVGVRLQMPPQAVVVALATAMQESKLRNLPHLGAQNDHDSIGLFQQRPSQGWGTPEQVGDPRYASERFYLALREVDGWEDMRVTDAAQLVQRSAFPEAYQQWADDADVLTTALLGRASAAVACRATSADPPTRGPTAVSQLRDAFADDWGEQPDRTFADLTTVDGNGQSSDGVAGLALSVPDQVSGWRYAHWLVAHAGDHGVQRVHFHDVQWTAAEGRWRPADGTLDDRVVVEVAPDQ